MPVYELVYVSRPHGRLRPVYEGLAVRGRDPVEALVNGLDRLPYGAEAIGVYAHGESPMTGEELGWYDGS